MIQFDLLKSGFIGLNETHRKAKTGNYDFKSLNYYCDIVEGFQNIKDFDLIQDEILKQIGGLNEFNF